MLSPRDAQHLTGNKVRSQQKQDGLNDIPGTARPSEGQALRQPFEIAAIALRGQDRPGRDGVHLDIRSQRQRKALRQSDEATLAHRVGHMFGARPAHSPIGNVHDVAPVPRGQLTGKRLTQEERCPQVDIQVSLPIPRGRGR